ncbi:hypothetical protein ACHHYP_14893 [Achlya hypogyna]|uniref:BROMI C-terminal Rab TBC-like domain-containing protein n=1 Tax=Achlya hypogyna TaxID=1202772 RepID=A0A1V9YC08_ACHHY|nr:hypothetical protein ACHHYP_14893 [Achlya hypogyna]
MQDDDSSVREVLGLFFSRTADIVLEDGESVDDALGRLRAAMKRLPMDAPEFWHLKLVDHLKGLLRTHLAEAIESFVDVAMAADPAWMLQSTAPPLLDAVVDSMILSHAPTFHALQTQLHEATAAQVATILAELRTLSSSISIQRHFQASTDALNARAQTTPRTDATQCIDALSIDDGEGDDCGTLWTSDALADDDDSPRLSPDEFSALLDRMALPSKARIEAFGQLQTFRAEAIVELGDTALESVAARLVPLCLDKDDVTSTGAIAFFHGIFVETQDAGAQSRLFATFLATLLHATPRAALFLRKPSISSPPPAQTPQRGLLRIVKFIHVLLDRLPAEWMFAPAAERARAQLLVAQWIGCWDLPGGNTPVEQSLTGATADWIPPASLLACLDPTARWFRQWHLRSPVKTQWTALLLDAGVVDHLVERVVHGHVAVELWRKFSRHTMAPAGVTYRRRSLSRAALTPATDLPSPLPPWYTVLMQKALLQAVYMLAFLLPLHQIQSAFPVHVAKTERVGGGGPLPEILEPDAASNQLLYRVKAPRTKAPSPGEAIQLDHLCLHLILMSVAHLWLSDAAAAAESATPLDAPDLTPLLEAVVASRPSRRFLTALVHVLRAAPTLEHERPKDIASIAFPYPALAVEGFDAVPAALEYLRQILVRRDLPRVVAIVAALLLAAVDQLLELPPDAATVGLILTLAADLPPVHERIAAACARSLAWLELFAATTWLDGLRRDGAALVNRDIVLCQLTSSALGLALGHDLLRQFPPDLGRLWRARDRRALLQVLNVPVLAATLLYDDTTFRRHVEVTVDALERHQDGFEAVVGAPDEAPFALRAAAQDMADAALLLSTPFAAPAIVSKAWWLQVAGGDAATVVALTLADAVASSSFRGTLALAMAPDARLWTCACPCAVDPMAWRQHRIQQRLHVTGGPSEVPRPGALELAVVGPLPVRPRTATPLRSLEAQVHRVQAGIKSATNYLDFKGVGTLFWHLVEDVEAQDLPGDALLTAWLGGIFFAVVLDAKSKFLQLAPTSTTDALPAPATALGAVNTWLKQFCVLRGLDPLPCTSLLPPTFAAFGCDGCEPFVWSILLLGAPRHTPAEVLGVLHTLRAAGAPRLLWPYAGIEPMYHVAAAVEWILVIEEDEVAAALRRLEVPVTTLVLRWLTHGLWSFVDWQGIMVFLNLVAIYGMDYLPLLVLVLIKQLAPVVARATRAADVLDAQVPGLRWSNHRAWIERLHSKYHDVIKVRLRAAFANCE